MEEIKEKFGFFKKTVLKILNFSYRGFKN